MMSNTNRRRTLGSNALGSRQAMERTCLLLACAVIWFAPAGEARTRSLDDTLPRQLTSYVTVFGGYHLGFGGNTTVEWQDEYNYHIATLGYSDLFKASPNVGVSIGTYGNGFGMQVGLRYSQYRVKSSVQVRDEVGNVVLLIPSDHDLSLYNFDFGLIFPLTNMHSRVIPVLAPSISSAADESFFQQSGRLFHVVITGMVIIRVNAKAAGKNYLGVIPSVSYDVGRKDRLPATLFVNVGLGWFMSRW